MSETAAPTTQTSEHTPQKPRKDWISSCHCNANRFTASLPVDFKASHCNCSFCQKEGALWCMAGVKSSDLQWSKGGETTLSSYTYFHKEDGQHIKIGFCPTCGTLMYGRREARGKDVVPVGLNARALRGIDVWALDKRSNEGKDEGTPYVPTKPTGIEFDKLEPGLKIYDGSCHCGAVTFKVKTRPLEEQTALDCNCSICVRNGYLWIYPPPEAVLLSPSSLDHLVGYSFVGGTHSHKFCKHCGSSLLNFIDGSVQRPVNVRCLDGVDCFKIKIKRYDGWGTREPQYNPD